MFLLKIFYFLKGYVIIELKGKKTHEFLNALMEENIRVWNVSEGTLSMWERDFHLLRSISRRTGVAVRIKEKCSLLRMIKNRSTWFFILCMAVYFSMLLMASDYIWCVKVDGSTKETNEKILRLAEEAGIVRGARKSTLPSLNELKDKILYSCDDINWAWVYFDGTTARISVRENTAPTKIFSPGEACNITAKRDGIIKSVSVRNGRKLLSNGVRVSEGEIIVSGVMPGGEKIPPYTVCAEGDVFAETVYTESCEYPLVKSYTKDTGYEKTLYSLRLFELEIPLFYKIGVDFAEYRTVTDTPPVGICTRRYIETETVTEPIFEDTAVWEAREALYEKILKKLSRGAKKTDERVITEKISQDRIKVTLIMNFIENIGIKTKIEESQMEEFTNDTTN